MANTSLRLPDELDAEIESQLSYGDSKAEWIREAIRIRQQIDPIVDEMYESHQREERIDLITAAVKKEVDRRQKEIENNKDN